ncbi:transmembrane protein PVRIG [Nycticebus coucang]|uniref:transmembrane protein PVRIG n=1 Tax=Nycticebus coucang TaxID=9470 RepID=UPI00234CD283|nr:transmembrane protein PVRIG [Nycticebus coucang]
MGDWPGGPDDPGACEGHCMGSEVWMREQGLAKRPSWFMANITGLFDTVQAPSMAKDDNGQNQGEAVGVRVGAVSAAPRSGWAGAMVGHQPLVLPWALLALCLTAGTPEVWVQVQMEATEFPSFTIRCEFLGSGSISLVTVSCGGPDHAGGTRLAVLHPELGTQQWAPARQAHWETRSSVSLTLEELETRSLSANTTFCCKFASFPEGSQEACGAFLPSPDPGFPGPTPVPILRADLAGILGFSGILLFGCIYLLYLLRRQRHWPVSKLQPPLASTQAQSPVQAAVPASLSTHHILYSSINTSFCPAALDMVHPHRQLSWWTPFPTHTACQPQATDTRPCTACSSFVSVENRLYAQAAERPPHTGPKLTPFPDTLGPTAMQGRLGAQ